MPEKKNNENILHGPLKETEEQRQIDDINVLIEAGQATPELSKDAQGHTLYTVRGPDGKILRFEDETAVREFMDQQAHKNQEQQRDAREGLAGRPGIQVSEEEEMLLGDLQETQGQKHH